MPVLLMLGCATPVTRYTLQEVVPPLVTSDTQLPAGALSNVMQRVVVSGVFYQLPVECLSARQFDGQVEKRTYAGGSEGRRIQSEWEQRLFSGAAESRALTGQTEFRVLNGANESRLHSVEAELRQVDAAAENRRYELLTERRVYGGQAGNLYCIPDDDVNTISIVNESWEKVRQVEVTGGIDVVVN